VIATPEDAIAALLAVADPALGLPPPEVIGGSLRASGIPLTPENAMRALAAADPRKIPSVQEVFAVINAGGSVGTAAPGTAAPRVSAQGGLTPEDVATALLKAVGPNAGPPPLDVVRQALTQMGLQATTQNMQRAVQAIVRGQQGGQQPAPPRGTGPAAGPGGAMTPEAVGMALLKVVGPNAGPPPAEVVGQALTQMGLPATPDNINRAIQTILSQQGAQQQQQQQQQPQAAPLYPEAMNTAKAALSSVQTPEDAVRALRQVAAATRQANAAEGAPQEAEEVPPPEIIGVTLRAMNIPVTAENVRRALAEAAGPGAPPPSMEDVMAALEAAANYTPGSLPGGMR